MNIHLTLQQTLSECFLKAYPALNTEPFMAEIKQSKQPQFGHYQCNSAMKLAKLLKQSPKQIAEVVVSALQAENNEMIAESSVAGPGFINITLSQSFLEKVCQVASNDSHIGAPLAQRKKVIIDFSSPNTAKEMHVGHLRSTIIGDTISRILEFQGHEVVRLNHIGDWGTAFGMLICYIKRHATDIIQNPHDTDIAKLVTCYKAAKKLFDEDSEFKKASQLEVVALQSGEVKSQEIWQVICDISRKSYQQIYDTLDIEIEERGESFYNPYLKELISYLEREDFIEESDGAKCLFIEGFQNREGEPLPFILQKSDGGFNYSSTDMAAIRHRIQEEKADWLIYVTDGGQATHFAMLFNAAEKVGWLDPTKVRVDHVPFGLVLGPDGKKFKTRSGETEKLIDLINKAIERADQLLLEKQADKTHKLEEQEIHHIAHALGINAIKYADLSCHRNNDYQFSYDRMLQFEGNTAAFLMYSYVRIHGIKRQIGERGIEIKQAEIRLETPQEMALALHLCQFPEILQVITQDLMPHHLCEYLYELANKFNVFFRDCRVIGSDQQNARLALCDFAEKVLKTGLTLLGLKTVDRM